MSGQRRPCYGSALSAGAACRARGYDLDQSAKLTFAVANAELDASIAAWNAKRRRDYVRPITAVRTRMKGRLVLAWAGPYRGTRLIRGESWSPYQASTFPTKPFPEYVCGHSSFSGAGARVLQEFTGSDLSGRVLGASVGQNAWAKAQQYFTGTAGG